MKRRAHPTDRRATLVTLTDAGAQMTAPMDAGYRAMGRELFDDFSEDEFRVFASGMDRILSRIGGPSDSDESR